jgi:hypothetical protein
MSRLEPLRRIPVGVVVERRRATSPWVDFLWRPVAVLPGVPDTEPWTVLGGDEECKCFYAGAGEIALYRSDAASYRDNLATGTALLWVVLRPTGREPPYEIAGITADPSEGEAFSETATDLIETVAMPDVIRAALEDFVAEHHVERPFVKRQRDRVSPEVMARQASAKEHK